MSSVKSVESLDNNTYHIPFITNTFAKLVPSDNRLVRLDGASSVPVIRYTQYKVIKCPSRSMIGISTCPLRKIPNMATVSHKLASGASMAKNT